MHFGQYQVQFDPIASETSERGGSPGSRLLSARQQDESLTGLGSSNPIRSSSQSAFCTSLLKPSKIVAFLHDWALRQHSKILDAAVNAHGFLAQIEGDRSQITGDRSQIQSERQVEQQDWKSGNEAAALEAQQEINQDRGQIRSDQKQIGGDQKPDSLATYLAGAAADMTQSSAGSTGGFTVTTSHGQSTDGLIVEQVALRPSGS